MYIEQKPILHIYIVHILVLHFLHLSQKTSGTATENAGRRQEEKTV